MVISDFLGWWYSRGFVWAADKLFVESSKKISHFFSISDLFKTLFAPFRQDVVNVAGAPIGVKLQAAGSNIIARFLGFLIRSALILTGFVMLSLNLLFAIVAILVWPLLPMTPALAIVLMALQVGV